MITRLSHITLYVENQDEAKSFYIETLDFEPRMDFRMDNGFRWLTVAPKTQQDLQIVLLAAPPNHVALPKTALIFQTPDCHRAVENLKARGVTIVSPATEYFHGTEAIFADASGNLFTLHTPLGLADE